MKNYFHLALLSLIVIFSPATQAATVLIYHHVSTSMPAATSISPTDFKAHLDYLAKHQFHIVPLTELTDKLKRHESLPDKTIAITFDDSYADVYTSAFPLLKERGWPFTFFANTDAVGSGKLFVSWDQLREMSKQGVTIANHTTKHNHVIRRNANETLAQWQARFIADINAAQAKIEQEIGSAPKIFAYPFGEYNVETKRLLEQLGYVAFTQQAGVLSNETQLQTLPRFPFGGSYTGLDDFIEKINTLPMPVKKVEFYADKQTPLPDMVVKAPINPYLVLSLSDESLLKKVHCFSSLEGAISSEILAGKLWVRGTKNFSAGRIKINCTAASSEAGRYFWYTQLWLAADKNGNWTYND